ncbi:MAG: HAMP domain-containing sensor histidine kinase [Bacteroidota bacterium]
MEKIGKHFSLRCNLDGRVIQILQDDDKVLSPSLEGSMLFSTVVTGDLDKMLNFFLELKLKGTAIGWEINVSTRKGPETYSFFGGVFDDSIGIAAATTKNGAQLLFTELTRINNEQTNLIRSISKENARLLNNSGEETGVSFYEELSRLNNELVNMQRELAKKNRDLARLSKLKDQFLGIAAHDLRSPIGVILGYSELLLDQDIKTNPSDQADLLQRIHKTGHFMLGLVNDLLDIANIESGKLELNLSEQDLTEVIGETIRMNEMFARAKSIKVKFENPGKRLKIYIDRPKIEQVLTNLLTNSIKYSFPKSKITISIESSPQKVRVSVNDQGQGIKEEELGKLFKPFQKTSTRSTNGEKSTGLGLLIVKKIVEAHKGEIGVTSKFGVGSEFFFTLPLKPPEPSALDAV